MLTVLSANGPSGYRIANSLRFRSSASAYLSRTPASAGNQRTFTFSTWLKRGALGNYIDFFGSGNTYLSYYNDNTLYMNLRGGATNYVVNYANVLRDPSAWYHIVWAVDTTQATASNRAKLYVNGVQLTAAGPLGQSYCPQNDLLSINSTSAHYLGAAAGSSNFFDGYMAEVNFIDGQALTPSAFGAFDATSGVWQPTRYSGTYGTNGFKLNFSNGTSTTTLGYDSSGNGNNWTTNNISLTAGSTYDWMIDSPTPYQGSSYGVGNYSVWNAVKLQGNSASNGNLRATLTAGGPPYLAGYGVRSTIAIPATGQWYCEITPVSSDTWSYVGIADINGGAADVGNAGLYSVLYRANGDKRVNGTASSYGASYTTDTIGIAVDSGAGTVTFYKNNTSQGSISLPSSSINYCFVVSNGNAQGISFDATFGQRPFTYTPPSGYKSLCTFNLPGPTINNGASYMAATLYTGNSSTQSISNAVNSVSFQPDFVWIKNRSGANSHQLADSIRGATKYLFSDATNAEETRTNQITSFLTAGFSLDSGAAVNASSNNYVGWQWKAGGTAVTNNVGSITSQVSANTTSGFSVVTYTGTGANGTVGHGLGVAPSMVIVKNRSVATSTGWLVYHSILGATNFLVLNSTVASAGAITVWNNTSPTASVFSVGTNTDVNQSTTNLVAYCFAAIPGYSAFGSYTGNGSTNGPFVYCGFRPQFVLIKRTDSAGYDWPMRDAARSPYNEVKNTLLANSSNAEATNNLQTDFLSNGFKLRDTGGNGNASGGTYIYAAFAENPFKYSLAR